MSSAAYRCVRVLETLEEARETRTLVLTQDLEALPGQFVMIWIPGLDEKPFCVAESEPLTVCVRRVGPLSEELFRLRPGDVVRYRGPFGHGFTAEGRRILLVGGGYGAAPLGFLCRRAARAGVAATLALGARTEADLLVTRNAREHAESIHFATEDGTAGTRGLVTVLAEALAAERSYDGLYGCGPNAMLDAVATLARRRSLPAQLSYERYMRCGLGICGSCEQDGLLVCRDGPVIRYPA